MTEAITPRAAVATDADGPDMLDVHEIELPPPAAGQARVRVTYAGINFWDVMQRRGVVPLPDSRVPGVEGVGTVEAVGEGVDVSLVGRRVAWSKLPGSCAEVVQGDAGWLLAVPNGVDDETAASVLMQGVTADYLIEAAPTIAEGESTVVFAAAGGVGTLLTQMLTARGAQVIGVVSREEKIETSRQAGAAHVLVDGDDLVGRVAEVSPDGARAVFDGNGGPQLPRDFGLCGVRGGVVIYGSAAGPLPDFDLDMLGPKSLSVQRVAGGNFAGDQASYLPRARRVLDAVTAGSLRPVVGRIAPLDEVASQHEHLESRRSTGKLLVDMR